MPKPSHKTSSTPAISVSGVTVAYDSEPVLERISFEIQSGEVVALIGPNGSGKTTLVKSILGIIRPKDGEIKIFGKRMDESRKRVGYVPQRFLFDRTFPISVREFLSLTLNADQKTKRIQEVIKEVGLTTSVLDKTLGTLSGGQLQRILIAQAIMNKPDLLVLDEPSTGIDVIGEATFYDIVKNLNEKYHTTIVLISHDVAMVSNKVDQVICINKRLMCVGPPKKTLTKATLERVFGKSSVFEHGHHHHDEIV